MLLVFLTVSQAAQTPAISDTPAGHTLRAWLESFNSGDRGQIQAYVAKYEPAKSVDGEMGFRNQTGGLELLSIDKSDRLYIEFQVKEKAGPTRAVGKMQVKEAGRCLP